MCWSWSMAKCFLVSFSKFLRTACLHKSSHWWCSIKKAFSKVFPEAWKCIGKETHAQVLSYEFCDIFKNTFFIEQLRWVLLMVLLAKTDSYLNTRLGVNYFLNWSVEGGLGIFIDLSNILIHVYWTHWTRATILTTHVLCTITKRLRKSKTYYQYSQGKLYFTQQVEAWLVLTFFLCLHNQLISIHSIVAY